MASRKSLINIKSKPAGQPSPTGTLNTILLSSSSMNRKAWRKARKSATKTVGDIVVSDAEDQTAHTEGLSTEPRLAEDTIEYECCICRDDFPFSGGVAHCEEHFTCNSCVVDAYNAAIADIDAFPAQCCSPFPRPIVEHLLSPKVRVAYSLRAEEHYTPRAIRVYCVNEQCRSYIPKSCVEDDHPLFTVARYSCGTNTCVGCKNEWEDEEHRCTDYVDDTVRPEWLPEYSASCRAKACPNCRMWMEHKEACNHMTCHYCHHEFCFVCLQPWTSEGFHQDAGCPSYGDPEEGYDNEGYELGGRGLHRDTGYNRMGLNRFGQRQLSHAVVEESAASEHDQYSDNEDLDYDEYEIDYADEEQWVDDAQFGNNERADGIAPQDEIEWGEPAQGGRPWDEELDAEQDVQILNFDNSWRVELVPFTDEANPVEATIVTSWDLAPASQGHSQASPPPDSVREQIRLARRVPILAPNPHPEDSVFSGGTPSFQQLECRHSWHRHLRLSQTEYGYAHCLGCNYIAGSWTNYCSVCGVVACDWCTYEFRGRFVSTWERETGLLDILIWAEKGVVPFKTWRRQVSEQLEDELWADCDEDILGLATMLGVYETQLFELQPYLYWDFGIRLMFEELELQMRKDYCAVTEEDVGIPGLTLTFDLATNPFAPLHWDS
jgi:hypothetical protein